eukprot:CAMPEP_0204820984 /NCGR_PEP_ID=MMETSP1018-20131115/944_1 /ASSEMBLY_ACC=CAM_ASM_000518 /TAXON_ID=46462 /ORGANISM="Anophryoides haemophila, Strain AH6" /LENGTH=58 /DNA_ID=CAMNT_0051918187 /DNA_START=31 /DNA_END=207 /DNA_ORIENTATION=+
MSSMKFGNTYGSMGGGGGGYGQSGTGMSNAVSLKGKLSNLEELIKSVSEDMNFNIKEV